MTDRDRSVVAWIAVIGAVSAQDVMARFGVGRTVGHRRLRALVDHGLLSRARLVYGPRGARCHAPGAVSGYGTAVAECGTAETALSGPTDLDAPTPNARWANAPPPVGSGA